ncbi:MAG: rhomboid family intramembrane serine protease [Cyclobacteriaceae bacterium]|nr:rhomboid family intramembrane serine protease [Cyclobacteriaceae bacterium]
MARSNRTIIGSAIVPFRFVFLMWLVFAMDFIYAFSFKQYGIIPRTTHGLIGILTSPLLHGKVSHIVSNTVPLLFLGAVLFFFYHRIAARVFFGCYFMTNILVWLFARYSNHIGASGLIYGLAFFLIFSGLFRRDLLSFFISLVVIFLYGYFIYGLFPSGPEISWEAHLSGAVVGTALSYFYRKKRYSDE